MRAAPVWTMLPSMGAAHPEQHERSANEPPEHLTFAEAAERLGTTPDAVRMRVHRGKLASVEVDGHRRVLWPQPEHPERPNERRTEQTGSVNGSAVRHDERLVAALEERIASLERHLAERVEESRRKDHIIAGLVQRVPELPAGQDAAVARSEGPQRAQSPTPASEPIEPWWRRWWRSVRGG